MSRSASTSLLIFAAIALPLALIRNLSLCFDELFSVFFSAQGDDRPRLWCRDRSSVAVGRLKRRVDRRRRLVVSLPPKLFRFGLGVNPLFLPPRHLRAVIM
jgi:hypothetical protein